METVAGIDLQLYIAAGIKDGPTLVVLGCIHGDEYEGPMAIAQVLEDFPVDQLKGTLVVLPVSNPPAFRAGTRTSPLDGKNLARCFPGDPEGSPSEQLARYIASELIAPADALIDLHSAGSTYEMALLAGYVDLGDEQGSKSRELAVAFGAPVLWHHPEVAPGRTISVAVELGVPCVYTESLGGGGAPEEAVTCYAEGVFRTIVSLGMLPGRNTPRHREVWRGAGDTDAGLAATCDGLFRSRVSVGQAVEAGAELGEVIDFDGTILERFVAEGPHIVALTRRTTRVAAGDSLFLLTSRVE
jgi:predicted deacylase